jgi:biopolymer transport protein ExbB/TolQ
MGCILVVGAAGLSVALERFYVIVVRSRVAGREFIDRLVQFVRAGKVEDAIKACARSKSTLPDIGLVILRSRSRDDNDLQHVATAAALTLVPRLRRRLQYLPALATLAVMLGLLGTVFGTRDALQTASMVAAGERTQRLAAGIAASLNATGLGLGIAVPLWVAYAYLRSQAETTIEQVHELSARLINALVDRPDVRLGHR